MCWPINFMLTIVGKPLFIDLPLDSHGWGNHPGKSGHGLTNFLTLQASLSISDTALNDHVIIM